MGGGKQIGGGGGAEGQGKGKGRGLGGRVKDREGRMRKGLKVRMRRWVMKEGGKGR